MSKRKTSWKEYNWAKDKKEKPIKEDILLENFIECSLDSNEYNRTDEEHF